MQNLSYFSEGDDLYGRMLELINSAEKSIDIESYIFADDGIGYRFLENLMLKAHQGITVQILVDSIGSKRLKKYKYFKKLSHSGIQLKWFNPWSWRTPAQFNRRNHRKIMIVDDQVCFMGGFNIHQESSQIYYGRNRWKDSHICFEGNLVAQIKIHFKLMWNNKFRQLLPIKSLNEQNQIIPNQTRSCRINLRCKLLNNIENAQVSIRLATPYFVPDSTTLKALLTAAKKGISVQLLVPKYGDQALLKYAAFGYYKKLIEAGIHIFEYLPRMLHSKYIIIDQTVAIIGSANMDYRSLFLNYEIMLFSFEDKLIDLLIQDFELSLSESKLVSSRDTSKKSYIYFFPSLMAFFLRKWL